MIQLIRTPFRRLHSCCSPVRRVILSYSPLSTSTLTDGAPHANTSSSHCRVIQGGLTALRQRFDRITEQNAGVFPILPSAATKQLLSRWNPNEYSKRAAVLIVIYSDHGVPSVLLTARSSELPLHASEISFPGGHVEGNESLEEAALREAEEELMGSYNWHDPEHLKVLGRGTSLPAETGTPVTPIIAIMTKDFSGQRLADIFPGDMSEVELVFGMPLQELLLTEENHTLPEHPLLGDSAVGPRYFSPYGYIWGLTAFMLRPLLHQLFKPVFQLENKDPV